MLLEGMYVYLLGPDFRYRMGVQGKYTDLFLWNVLLNRKEMAEMMWTRCVARVKVLGFWLEDTVDLVW